MKEQVQWKYYIFEKEFLEFLLRFEKEFLE